MNQRNVRSTTIRKEGRDVGLTPTEKHQKNQFMRQFVKGDGERGNTEAYREGYAQIDWSKTE